MVGKKRRKPEHIDWNSPVNQANSNLKEKNTRHPFENKENPFDWQENGEKKWKEKKGQFGHIGFNVELMRITVGMVEWRSLRRRYSAAGNRESFPLGSSQTNRTDSSNTILRTPPLILPPCVSPEKGKRSVKLYTTLKCVLLFYQIMKLFHELMKVNFKNGK